MRGLLPHHARAVYYALGPVKGHRVVALDTADAGLYGRDPGDPANVRRTPAAAVFGLLILFFSFRRPGPCLTDETPIQPPNAGPCAPDAARRVGVLPFREPKRRRPGEARRRGPPPGQPRPGPRAAVRRLRRRRLPRAARVARSRPSRGGDGRRARGGRLPPAAAPRGDEHPVRRRVRRVELPGGPRGAAPVQRDGWGGDQRPRLPRGVRPGPGVGNSLHRRPGAFLYGGTAAAAPLPLLHCGALPVPPAPARFSCAPPPRRRPRSRSKTPARACPRPSLPERGRGLEEQRRPRRRGGVL